MSFLRTSIIVPISVLGAACSSTPESVGITIDLTNDSDFEAAVVPECSCEKLPIFSVAPHAHGRHELRAHCPTPSDYDDLNAKATVTLTRGIKEAFFGASLGQFLNEPGQSLTMAVGILAEGRDDLEVQTLVVGDGEHDESVAFEGGERRLRVGDSWLLESELTPAGETERVFFGAETALLQSATPLERSIQQGGYTFIPAARVAGQLDQVVTTFSGQSIGILCTNDTCSQR
jgi:hypothetical protein